MTTKAELLRAIRSKCMDCCCDQLQEVKFCPIQTCDLWPFRMGKDPNPSGRGYSRKSPAYTDESVEETAFKEKAPVGVGAPGRGETEIDPTPNEKGNRTCGR